MHEYARLVELLDEASGNRMVKILDAGLNEIRNLSEKEFMSQKIEEGEIAVMGCVVNQSLIDRVGATPIKCLIVERLGEVFFVPSFLEICSRHYLEKFLPKSPMMILGYRNPITDKTVAMLEKMSEKFNFSLEYVDLSEKPEFFEKYAFDALPALVFKGRVVCQGSLKEEDVSSIFERGSIDAGTAGRRIAELDKTIKDLVREGKDVLVLTRILEEAKNSFDRDDYKDSIGKCEEAGKIIGALAKKREGISDDSSLERYCNQCGAYLESHDLVCPRCGASAGPKSETEEIERLVEKCEELKEKLAVLTRRFQAGEIVEETYEILRERVDKEREEVNASLERFGAGRCE